MPDSPTHTLTPEETRFLLWYALKLIRPSTLKDMQSGNNATRERSLEMATKTIMNHMKRAGHQIIRPERDGSKPLFG
jgi:hypothetical protein